MGKDKDGKKGSGKGKADKAGKPSKAEKAIKPPKAPKPAKAAKPAKAPKAEKIAEAGRAAKNKAIDLVTNPLVAEVVAATLVAAAAALRDPKKARQMADSAGETMGRVKAGAKEEGGAFWTLAMDIAKRSVDALGEAVEPSGSKAGKKSGGK